MVEQSNRFIPLFTSVSGPDGSGKTTVSTSSAFELGKTIAVGYIGSVGMPPFFLYRGKQQMCYQTQTNMVDALYKNAQNKRSPLAVFASLVLHSFVIGRFIEPRLTQMGVQVVIRDRDPFADPAVLSKVYVANMPVLTLINIIQAVSNHQLTDILFLLEVTEKIANERIKTSDQPDLHELKVKFEDYERVIPILQSQGYIKRLERVSNNSNDLLTSVQQISKAILSTLK